MQKDKKIVKAYMSTANEIPTVVDFYDFEVSEEDIDDDEYEFFEEDLLEVAKE